MGICFLYVDTADEKVVFNRAHSQRLKQRLSPVEFQVALDAAALPYAK